MAIIFDPETGEYRWDYENGPMPDSQAPFDPTTGLPLPPAPPLVPIGDPVTGGGRPSGNETAPPPPPTDTAPPPPTDTGAGGGSAGGGLPLSIGELLSLPQLPSLRELPNIPGAPSPNLPTFTRGPAYQAGAEFAPTKFVAPTPESLATNPDYLFRRSQGEGSLQRWAAGKGTLNDSGTAKALMEYGGNAASQELSNIWNRSFTGWQGENQMGLAAHRENEGNRLNAYNTNYQTQYVDPYKFEYQRGMDLFTPQLAQWQAGVDMSKLGYQAGVDLDRLGYSTQAAWNQGMNNNTYQDFWNRQRNLIDLAGA